MIRKAAEKRAPGAHGVHPHQVQLPTERQNQDTDTGINSIRLLQSLPGRDGRSIPLTQDTVNGAHGATGRRLM